MNRLAMSTPTENSPTASVKLNENSRNGSMTPIQSSPAAINPAISATKATMRMLFESQKGGFHLGSGTRWGRSCSNPNWQPQPQMDLLDTQAISNRTTNIAVMGSTRRCFTRMDVSSVRSEETGLGFSPPEMRKPKRKPKTSTPPMRKAIRTLDVTLWRMRRNVAAAMVPIHRTNLTKTSGFRGTWADIGTPPASILS